MERRNCPSKLKKTLFYQSTFPVPFCDLAIWTGLFPLYLRYANERRFYFSETVFRTSISGLYCRLLGNYSTKLSPPLTGTDTAVGCRRSAQTEEIPFLVRINTYPRHMICSGRYLFAETTTKAKRDLKNFIAHA